MTKDEFLEQCTILMHSKPLSEWMQSINLRVSEQLLAHGFIPVQATPVTEPAYGERPPSLYIHLLTTIWKSTPEGGLFGVHLMVAGFWLSGKIQHIQLGLRAGSPQFNGTETSTQSILDSRNLVWLPLATVPQVGRELVVPEGELLWEYALTQMQSSLTNTAQERLLDKFNTTLVSNLAY